MGQKAATLQLDTNHVSALGDFVAFLQALLQAKLQTQHLDFLINNAGMGATVPFDQVSENLFDDFLNVHFKCVYFLTQKLPPLLNDDGGVVNIYSGTARFAKNGYLVYANMKGAIEVLPKYLAKELGEKSIRVNVIAPGPIEMDFNNAAIHNNPQMKERLRRLSPLGRMDRADDIGGVVAFLCSEARIWINGQHIEVCGGIQCMDFNFRDRFFRSCDCIITKLFQNSIQLSVSIFFYNTFLFRMLSYFRRHFGSQ